jgi:predicted short-subunit dehydrogenase-like oxidoreductase (DUF2520 family)
MKISFVGAGNVAWHLAQAFDKTNHQVLEVFSRDLKNAEKLCKRLYTAEPKKDLNFSTSKAEIIFLCVPDDAIQELAWHLKAKLNTILVHISGSKGLQQLQLFPNPKGVFYPLQTFTKQKAVNFKTIPICLEASDKQTEKVLETLAFSICDNVAFVDSNDRKTLHIAAVFACNFSNHLLSIAKGILEKEGLDFEILKPLIIETIDKALEVGPENAQTGPAIRKDIKVLEEHFKSLEYNPELQKLYKLMSDSIINR